MAAAQGAGSAFQAVNSVGGGYVHAQSLRDQASYQSSVTDLNNKTLEYQAGQADEQATDAVKRGNTAVNTIEQKNRLQTGAERASAAAQGGLSSVGSEAVANANSNTESANAAEQATVKINAWREAYGYQSQGNALRGQEDANTLQSRTSSNALEYSARSSMITGWNEGIYGGLRAAEGFAKNSKTDVTPKSVSPVSGNGPSGGRGTPSSSSKAPYTGRTFGNGYYYDQQDQLANIYRRGKS